MSGATDVDGETVRIEIERAHMEEDTGKSLHVGGATGRIHGADHSLVDYNRAGIPLIEIVTKPIEDMGAKAPAVARAYVAHLRDLLKGLGVSDVRMDQGSLRCDVNLSLRADAVRAARHPQRDQERQLAALGRARGPLRGLAAGGAADARGAGGPGDPALARGHRRHDLGAQQGAGRGLPLLPRARPGADRPGPGVGRGAQGSAARAARRATRAAARRVGLHRAGDARRARRRRARPDRGDGRRRREPGGGAASGGCRSWPAAPTTPASGSTSSPITPAQVAGVQALVDSGRINDKLARQVLDGVLAGEGTPEEVVAARGLEVVSDEGALSAAVDRAIEANPDVADKIRDGKVAAAGALIGAVMKEMRGQADAGRVRELILEKLG